MPVEWGVNPDTGQSGMFSRKSDMWSRTIEEIPFTPTQKASERSFVRMVQNRGEKLAQLEIAKTMGIPIPEAIRGQLGGVRELNRAVQRGDILCPPHGHTNEPGARFCVQCGESMRAREVIAAEPVVKAADGLDDLTREALVRRCQSRGVNAEGTRDELAGRLRATGLSHAV